MELVLVGGCIGISRWLGGISSKFSELVRGIGIGCDDKGAGIISVIIGIAVWGNISGIIGAG